MEQLFELDTNGVRKYGKIGKRTFYLRCVKAGLPGQRPTPHVTIFIDDEEKGRLHFVNKTKDEFHTCSLFFEGELKEGEVIVKVSLSQTA